MDEKPRLFQINRSAFSRHYDVVSRDGPFYVDISVFSPGKPDLVLRQGDDKGAVLGVCHLVRLSRTFKVGLGDPDAKPDAVQWEDMSRASVGPSEYRWTTSLPRPSAGAPGRATNLLWKRTQSVGAAGASPSKLSLRNWKLVAEGAGDDVLAVFTSDRSLTRCGTLEIRAAFGREFDCMVLLTCVALYEKARRRKNRAAASGGGGGGG